MQDAAYRDRPYLAPTLSHRYGAHVHVLHDPVALAELAELSAKGTPPGRVAPLVRGLYRTLLRHAVATSWPRRPLQVATRMIDATERGVWHGSVPDNALDVVVVDIARAGTVPAQLCYETLGALLGDARVRQDHLTMGRQLTASGAVDGVTLHSSKVAGPAQGAWVLLPDPMGATGTSMAAAVAHYKGLAPGPPQRILALHLIVTPEYLATMKKQHPDVDVWAVRLDRGMSAAHIFATEPGTHWAEEKGLNAQQYIVPGAGGLGELLNNAER